jgi:hypothetical protein
MSANKVISSDEYLVIVKREGVKGCVVHDLDAMSDGVKQWLLGLMTPHIELSGDLEIQVVKRL